ncbi:hypothetical protein [Methylosinus sp. Ce-a6]|uniref:hypothetical protein n=1 Tax=Methylosinus sp. Ce-a6 TaxID=2172005 RepID=UPI001356CE1B|nr:hypothetical protein [Methylosinus sp. Ce-a6]
MSNVVKLSLLGAASAVIGFAAPIGGGVALAGPVGMADVTSVSLPAATDQVHYRHGRSIYRGRSAHYCPPRRIEHRTVYVRNRYIVERRTAYVAAPVATAVAVPVVAATYPGYGYGYGGPGIVGAGAGLLGGALNIGFGGWGGPGWGGGWGWRRGWWW